MIIRHVDHLPAVLPTARATSDSVRRAHGSGTCPPSSARGVSPLIADLNERRHQQHGTAGRAARTPRWEVRRGTTDQKGRHAARLLPLELAREGMANEAFAVVVDALQGLRRFGPASLKCVCHVLAFGYCLCCRPTR